MNRIALISFVLLLLSLVPAYGGGDPEVPPMKDNPEVPLMKVDELKRLFDQNAVIILDVRSEESYLLGHIPGALLNNQSNFSEIAEKLKKTKKTIVTYCSCPDEASSIFNAKVLRDDYGIGDVSALLGGYDEWVSRGYPVEANGDEHSDVGTKQTNEPQNNPGTK
jgi:rhodanese-related sulfurtransferase